MLLYTHIVAAAALVLSAGAVSIHDINGKRFVSDYAGKNVSDVTGIVTAKGKAGIYLRSPELSDDKRVSNGLFVSSASLGKNESIRVGHTLTLSGQMWYVDPVSSSLYTATLKTPTVQAWNKTSHSPKPLVIGKDTPAPPNVQFTSLDNGNFLATPNNQSRISEKNPELEPTKYGLDFWRSLDGELVKIETPIAISKTNQYGDVWIRGNWNSTNINKRGGLTLTAKDGNPETIKVGDILDGSKGESYSIGDRFEDIVGVVNYVHGAYFVHPLGALKKIGQANSTASFETKIKSNSKCSGITVGDYNIENLSPADPKHVSRVAAHIAKSLGGPDLLFVQEVQDNSGPTDDNVVDANKTLRALTDAISEAGGPKYSFIDVNPADNQDGGQPGGNIRQAYLYNKDVVRLAPGPIGGTEDANEVVSGPALKYKVGRISPISKAFNTTRKPLAAEWQTVDGNHTIFTVNVHFTMKGGSTPLTGNIRPPVNQGVDYRTEQAEKTAAFIAEILKQDKNASVIFAGDANEFPVAGPMVMFAKKSGLKLIDEVVGIEPNERYSYTYENNMQQLDVMYVSESIASKKPIAEHLHVNTWVTYEEQVSDHDPTVAKINVC
ncbi:hypothetical protein MCUN1_000051 [Malassezia cuniculi]|uniref:Endonuclease/exonuclease/phosphatase domain-containing protein n=1 Tax=Malassezia cuniculi TaxID=948313 RepID=A0AAF0J4I6_9BASI|nr:hypothetical protein MCUN1_000051 [Malassezia cuniculi]